MVVRCTGDVLLGYEKVQANGYSRSMAASSEWRRSCCARRSGVSAKDFLEKLLGSSPFIIRMVQAGNGTEFTNALLATKCRRKTLFEEA